jgi:6,7-dimethyl-8-ribityllumazine synthase
MDHKFTKICIVASDFYPELTEVLVSNCTNTLKEKGITNIKIIKVPGCFEIPFTIKKLMNNNFYSAYIALGVIIKGETSHFEYVCSETARGIMDLNLIGTEPVIFGVLMCKDEQQVKDRLTNGKEFAETAIKMINLNK